LSKLHLGVVPNNWSKAARLGQKVEILQVYNVKSR